MVCFPADKISELEDKISEQEDEIKLLENKNKHLEKRLGDEKTLKTLIAMSQYGLTMLFKTCCQMAMKLNHIEMQQKNIVIDPIPINKIDITPEKVAFFDEELKNEMNNNKAVRFRMCTETGKIEYFYVTMGGKEENE